MAAFGSWLADQGFGNPSGLLGRLGGRLMARANAATERHVVGLAELAEEDVVLMVGPGPGVGLQAAAQRAARVIGLDPSEVMLEACRRRCATALEHGQVQLVRASAAQTGLPDCSVDVAVAVNNVQIWPDWQAGCAELARVLRPGGRLWFSAHRTWLPGGPAALAETVAAAGFTDIRTWDWEPPGRGATTAAQLRATAPS